MKTTTQIVLVLGLCVLGLSFLGCNRGAGVEVGKVHGTVTLDGEPLANVEVTFRPKEGRASIGITDEKGEYEVSYTGGKAMGAQTGPCVVSIAWGTGVTGPKIPAEFAKMDREITKGKNEFNFDM